MLVAFTAKKDMEPVTSSDASKTRFAGWHKPSVIKEQHDEPTRGHADANTVTDADKQTVIVYGGNDTDIDTDTDTDTDTDDGMGTVVDGARNDIGRRSATLSGERRAVYASHDSHVSQVIQDPNVIEIDGGTGAYGASKPRPATASKHPPVTSPAAAKATHTPLSVPQSARDVKPVTATRPSDPFRRPDDGEAPNPPQRRSAPAVDDAAGLGSLQEEVRRLFAGTSVGVASSNINPSGLTVTPAPSIPGITNGQNEPYRRDALDALSPDRAIQLALSVGHDGTTRADKTCYEAVLAADSALGAALSSAWQASLGVLGVIDVLTAADAGDLRARLIETTLVEDEAVKADAAAVVAASQALYSHALQYAILMKWIQNTMADDVKMVRESVAEDIARVDDAVAAWMQQHSVALTELRQVWKGVVLQYIELLKNIATAVTASATASSTSDTTRHAALVLDAVVRILRSAVDDTRLDSRLLKPSDVTEGLSLLQSALRDTDAELERVLRGAAVVERQTASQKNAAVNREAIQASGLTTGDTAAKEGSAEDRKSDMDVDADVAAAYVRLEEATRAVSQARSRLGKASSWDTTARHAALRQHLDAQQNSAVLHSNVIQAVETQGAAKAALEAAREVQQRVATRRAFEKITDLRSAQLKWKAACELFLKKCDAIQRAATASFNHVDVHRHVFTVRANEIIAGIEQHAGLRVAEAKKMYASQLEEVVRACGAAFEKAQVAATARQRASLNSTRTSAEIVHALLPEDGIASMLARFQTAFMEMCHAHSRVRATCMQRFYATVACGVVLA